MRDVEAMVVSIVLAVGRWALRELADGGDIFRVNSLVHEEFRSGRDLPLVLEDPECLVRPEDSSARRSPSKTARLTQSLCLSQIGLAASQIFFCLPANAVFDGQFAVEMSI